jgi:hypothetical protein
VLQQTTSGRDFGQPDGRSDAIELNDWFDAQMSRIRGMSQSKNVHEQVSVDTTVVCSIVHAELAAQLYSGCKQRGQLLEKVWTEFSMLLLKTIQQLSDRIEQLVTSYDDVSVVAQHKLEECESWANEVAWKSDMKVRHFEERMHDLEKKVQSMYSDFNLWFPNWGKYRSSYIRHQLPKEQDASTSVKSAEYQLQMDISRLLDAIGEKSLWELKRTREQTESEVLFQWNSILEAERADVKAETRRNLDRALEMLEMKQALPVVSRHVTHTSYSVAVQAEFPMLDAECQAPQDRDLMLLDMHARDEQAEPSRASKSKLEYDKVEPSGAEPSRAEVDHDAKQQGEPSGSEVDHDAKQQGASSNDGENAPVEGHNDGNATVDAATMKSNAEEDLGGIEAVDAAKLDDHAEEADAHLNSNTVTAGTQTEAQFQMHNVSANVAVVPAAPASLEEVDANAAERTRGNRTDLSAAAGLEIDDGADDLKSNATSVADANPLTRSVLIQADFLEVDALSWPSGSVKEQQIDELRQQIAILGWEPTPSNRMPVPYVDKEAQTDSKPGGPRTGTAIPTHKSATCPIIEKQFSIINFDSRLKGALLGDL